MDRVLSFLIGIIAVISGYSESLSRIGIGTFERWHPGEKLKLLIVGYNGARNTGADARVAAIVRQIRDVFGPDHVQITVMTLNRDSLAGYFDEDVILLEFSTIFMLSLYRACCENHAAVLSEGSTLKSTFANGLTLFLCEAAAVMRRQKKPCIAYGSEIGTMEEFLKKAAVRMCSGTYFITRTKESQERLEELGLQGHTGTDTAWIYDGAIGREEAEEMLKAQGWDGKKPLIGMAVIDPFCWPVRASLTRWLRTLESGDHTGQYDKWYYYSDSEERRAAFHRYTDAWADAFRRYAEDTDCFPVVIGMERLDKDACLELKDKLGRDCAVFLSGEHPASVMTGILRCLSSLVTSRYHASVLSMKSGIPITAVSMDERLDNIMREIGMAGSYLHHVSDPDLSDRILHSLKEGDRHRDEIRAQLDEAYGKYEEKVEQMGLFLKEYIMGRLA